MDARVKRYTPNLVLPSSSSLVVVLLVLIPVQAYAARARLKDHIGAIIISTNIISHPGGANKHTKQTLFSLFLIPLSSRMDEKDEQNMREIHSAVKLQSSGLGLARFWG